MQVTIDWCDCCKAPQFCSTRGARALGLTLVRRAARNSHPGAHSSLLLCHCSARMLQCICASACLQHIHGKKRTGELSAPQHGSVYPCAQCTQHAKQCQTMPDQTGRLLNKNPIAFKLPAVPLVGRS